MIEAYKNVNNLSENYIHWPQNEKMGFIGKDADVEENGRQKKKGMAEDEIDSVMEIRNMNLDTL